MSKLLLERLEEFELILKGKEKIIKGLLDERKQTIKDVIKIIAKYKDMPRCSCAESIEEELKQKVNKLD